MQFLSHCRWPGWLAVALLLFVAGSSGNSPSTKSSTDDKSKDGKPERVAEQKKSDAEKNPTTAEVVQIKPVNLAGYKSIIEQFKGKVIVVDWWFFL